jgi:hypothetical protein
MQRIGKIWLAIAAAVAVAVHAVPVGAVEAPREIAGFVLGEDIGRHQQRCDMQTSLPIRYLESVREVQIRDLPDFKSGLIAFGSCAAPNRILRIKLKYADGSREFFDALLSQYRRRFGDATEWRGDPFHMVIAWKWSFTDSQGNRISLVLQHNSLNEEEKMGNAVKLSLSNLLEQERDCLERDERPVPAAEQKKSPPFDPRHVDWNRFVPR